MSFSTERSICLSNLMLACFTQLSPELEAFDKLAASKYATTNAHPSSRITLPDLPPEIHLLIRAELVDTLVAHHRASALAALSAYECALRNLLCPACQLYNVDVYGPDVWEWENFPGPCSCVGYTPPKDPLGLDQPVAMYMDRYHWLEDYLTRELRKASFNGDIWDGVRRVLGALECDVVGGASPAYNYHRVLTLGLRCGQGKRWCQYGGTVKIAPAQRDGPFEGLDCEKRNKMRRFASELRLWSDDETDFLEYSKPKLESYLQCRRLPTGQLSSLNTSTAGWYPLLRLLFEGVGFYFTLRHVASAVGAQSGTVELAPVFASVALFSLYCGQGP